MYTTRTLSFALAMILFPAVFGISQERPRSLDERSPEYNYPNNPISVVSRALGNTVFSKESHIRADRSWLKNLAFTVQNQSKKTITFIRIELVIKDQGKLTGQMRMPVEFGRPEPVLDGTGKPSAEYRRPVLKP